MGCRWMDGNCKGNLQTEETGDSRESGESIKTKQYSSS
jgi:hypothetical protein